MPKTTPQQNKAIVLEAFDTLFNKRDYAAAERFWSPKYIQHSAHIPPGREGLFALVHATPDTLHYENQLIVAEGDYVIAHGRFTGMGRPAAWIAADVVRFEDGLLAEHWDVLQDEAQRKNPSAVFPCLETHSLHKRSASTFGATESNGDGGQLPMGGTKKLQGKVAVITGGTTGIGLAAAKLFVKEGAYVFITGRRQKELDEAVKAIGSNVTGVQGDIAKLTDLDRLYEAVATKGRIDVVFANAGVAEFAPLGKITEEHFDKLFDINVKGTLFTVQKALPLLNDGGSIILNGSVASVKGTPAFGVYGATKAALRSFVRTWTSDLKDRHIRSNVISPGPTDTPVIDGQPADAIARIVSTIPMGRMGEPDEIAKAALFLASDDSSFVTGIELFVDGGRGQV